MTWLNFVACLLVAALPAGAFDGRHPSPGQALETRCAAVRRVLEEFRASSGFPGAIVGVCDAGGASFAVAVGYSDREAKTPMRETDLLHAGSAGKTLFAALALQLVAAGRLSLDDKVAKYLGGEPWFAGLPNAGAITVRMLLNHTSGLPGYGDSFMQALVESPSRERSPLDAVKSISGAKPTNAVGAAFSYSDVNYQLLGFVCEHVTGRPAYDEIRRRILEPLSLRLIVPADRPKIPGLVPGYAGAKNPFGGDKMLVDGALRLDPRFEWGGGGFVTNPRDLARWLADFSEGLGFSPKLLPVVLETVDAPDLGKGSRSGLGVEVEPTPLGDAYGHGGYFPGYFTQVRWYPRERIAVAIQLNTSDESLVNRSLKDVVDELAKAALAPAPGRRSRLPARRAAQLGDEALDALRLARIVDRRVERAELGRNADAHRAKLGHVSRREDRGEPALYDFAAHAPRECSARWPASQFFHRPVPLLLARSNRALGLQVACQPAREEFHRATVRRRAESLRLVLQ